MATLITKTAYGHSMSPSGCVSVICHDDLRHCQHVSEKSAVMVNGFSCPTAQNIWATLNVEFDLCTGLYIHFIPHTKWSGDSSYVCYAINLCEQHGLFFLNMYSALTLGLETLIWNVHENMSGRYKKTNRASCVVPKDECGATHRSVSSFTKQSSSFRLFCAAQLNYSNE